MSTTDRNGRQHAPAGEWTEGRNGALYAPGEYLPESEEQRADRLRAERAASEAQYRATHKPHRMRLPLSYCEEHGLAHGQPWKYSWKAALAKSNRLRLHWVDGREDWHGQLICYCYPASWAEYDAHVAQSDSAPAGL